MSDVNTTFVEAVKYHQAGDLERAEAIYRQLLKEFPAHAPSLTNLGVLLVRQGNTDEAVQCYNLALASTPGHADAHFNLGNLHRRSNHIAEAVEQYRACLANNPQHTSASYNLGLCFSTLGELDSARDAFRRVCEKEPTNVDAHSRLGDAYIRSGKLEAGLAAFQRCVELDPENPRSHYNLGLALSNLSRTQEAHTHLHKALKARPDYPEAHNAIGLNLEAQGRKDDALFHYQESVRLNPQFADGWSNLGSNLSEQGQTDNAIEALRESLQQRPQSPHIHSNLLLMLNYNSNLSVEEISDEHRLWGEQFTMQTLDAPTPFTPHDPERKLRIGYVSADFRDHTVSGFIEQLLTHHDRERFEVYAYSNGLHPDAITDKLKKLADHWRPIGAQSEELVFNTIQQDRIDILIDLSGHTAGNRLLVFGARPAALQATLFGYPNTSGINAMDVRVTDAISDPVGQTETLYAEELLRLPEVPWVYQPPESSPEITELPGLNRRAFTFGCLNNPAKISEECLQTWSALLQSTPGSRLVLLAGQSQSGAKRLLDRFTRAGILRDRIELVNRMAKKDYFETYQLFDVALDPFPYNGGVTSCDSLWMGVPFFALEGHNYASRQGEMLLRSLGLDDFIADSTERLIQLGRVWMHRRTELAEIRMILRERMQASPLLDGQRYVRNLETALRAEWAARLPIEMT